MEKQTQFSVWYALFAVMAVLWLHSMWVQMRTVEPLPYSEFQVLLKDSQIEDISITDNYIQGTLKKPLPDGRQKFVTTRVDPQLAADLAKYDVKFSGVVESTFLKDVLGWVLPAVVFVAIWLFAMRRIAEKQGLGGGFMAIGKSKARIYMETDTRVGFDDVAGVDEAKEELREVVGFLKNPGDYGRLGGRVPKGVLLVGPPGTGKTLLARAVAGEASVPFFLISGSEFVEMFVGVGAARVRDLFEQARQNWRTRWPCCSADGRRNTSSSARHLPEPSTICRRSPVPPVRRHARWHGARGLRTGETDATKLLHQVTLDEDGLKALGGTLPA